MRKWEWKIFYLDQLILHDHLNPQPLDTNMQFVGVTIGSVSHGLNIILTMCISVYKFLGIFSFSVDLPSNINGLQ